MGHHPTRVCFLFCTKKMRGGYAKVQDNVLTGAVTTSSKEILNDDTTGKPGLLPPSRGAARCQTRMITPPTRRARRYVCGNAFRLSEIYTYLQADKYYPRLRTK